MHNGTNQRGVTTVGVVSRAYVITVIANRDAVKGSRRFMAVALDTAPTGVTPSPPLMEYRLYIATLLMGTVTETAGWLTHQMLVVVLEDRTSPCQWHVSLSERQDVYC